ncbi:MAG: CusA/CzcA family heavy metal efflux RND transporter [Chthoniobacterales bacterium]
MIDRLVSWCLGNRAIVLTATLFLTIAGIDAIYKTPVDAIPDLSENQVIVLSDWAGRSAQEVEDQVTFPLSTALEGLAGVREVRAQSAFGFSMLTVIFRDDVDIYFARTRVLEKLSALPFRLPEGVTPRLGPDATSIGWIYEYYLDDSVAAKAGHALDLGQLRSLQDWFVRLQLSAVPGVAEVASIGGFVRQYQVDVNPSQLRAYGLPLSGVIEKIRGSSRNVGGGNIEVNGRDITIRGVALIHSPEDLKSIPVGYSQGRPILLEQVATVAMGPEPRRGALDVAGHEAVGGVVVMRYGESTRAVIKGVKQKIAEISKALPPGVTIKSFYDRSQLIDRAVGTLRLTLIEEIILVTLAHLLFLGHLRSVLIVTLPLPLSILFAFILMKWTGVTSNIMSLSGLAIAIGVLVDAAVVVTEAVIREAHAVQEGRVPGLSYPKDIVEIVRRATRMVIRPIFFAMMIILLAFIPVFALQGEAGKLFHPLAFTKSYAMAGAMLLALTFVPVLASLLVRGRLRNEGENPVMRFLLRLYRPALEWSLDHRKAVIVAAVVILLVALSLGSRIGWDFMPPLNERALLYMPTTLPSASVPEIKRVMSAQDKILSSFPEVESVVGKLGRADTATDPAPVSMIETTIMLKPLSAWRPGMTMEKLRSEMLQKMQQFPGFVPAFLQPIESRILMLNTGIRGQVAVKIFGSDLKELERLAVEVEGILKNVPGATDVYAERVAGTPYLDITVRRDDAARYGVSITEINTAIESAIGGATIETAIDGRQRIPIRVRYPRELRGDLPSLEHVLVASMQGENIPLSNVADFQLKTGPSMISSENGMMRVFVQANVRERALADFVQDAQEKVSAKLSLPPGYYISWGGQYQKLLAASRTLLVICPLVILIIFVLLFITYRSWKEAAHVLLAVPFALSGGLYLQWLLGYHFSVAVAIGYIALFGTAVQTAVIMVIYLNDSLDRKIKECGDAFSLKDLRMAVLQGALLRLRPKVMTVATIVASLMVILLPVFSGERTGIEIMRPIAVPVVGGMISSLIHILIVTPVLFFSLRKREMAPNMNLHD